MSCLDGCLKTAPHEGGCRVVATPVHDAPPRTYSYWTIHTRYPVPHPRHRSLTCTLKLDPEQGYEIDGDMANPGVAIISTGPHWGESAALVIPWHHVLDVLLEETEQPRNPRDWS